MNPPTEYQVETYSGRYVDTRNPSPDTIHLEDIAHALSMTCRYGGHCRKFYSVAEHAVYVSLRLERKGYSVEKQYAGLHHDDSEAFLGDIPRPTKKLLGKAYGLLTTRMDRVVCEALNADYYPHVYASDFHQEWVKEADNWCLFLEARHLLPSQGRHWSSEQKAMWNLPDQGRVVTPDYWEGGLPPEEAKAMFLERHTELTA